MQEGTNEGDINKLAQLYNLEYTSRTNYEITQYITCEKRTILDSIALEV